MGNDVAEQLQIVGGGAPRSGAQLQKPRQFASKQAAFRLLKNEAHLRGQFLKMHGRKRGKALRPLREAPVRKIGLVLQRGRKLTDQDALHDAAANRVLAGAGRLRIFGRLAKPLPRPANPENAPSQSHKARLQAHARRGQRNSCRSRPSGPGHSPIVCGSISPPKPRARLSDTTAGRL